jgi:alkanesulfonate monooxygenase SsuD/methylene tetrahydromethanopterin reductase-like flavin-dependent oxidoreductase (luciferase family)
MVKVPAGPADGRRLGPVRYTLSVPNIGDLDVLLELGSEAEAGGWDAFFVWDHIRFLRGVPVAVFDPWVALTAIAERTERIRIGPMVTPVARRRPWKLARETVTLDHLSRGRLTLGVGLGFPADAEFELLGEDPDDRVRAAKLDEGLDVLVRLWSGETVDHDGLHYRVHETQFLPTPLQRPRIPIWVAGVWPNRAPFRRAARWDGVFPLELGAEGGMVPLEAARYPEMLAYVGAHRSAEEPLEVVASGVANGDHGVVAPFERAGATWWIESDEGYPGWPERMLERIRSGPPR